MLKNKHIATALLCAALTVTACSDSDDWTPGPAASPDSMGAYFGDLASYNMVIGPDDSRIIPVTVGRSKTDESAVVPITVVEAPEGADVPQSVEFAKDQQTATMFINLENMPSKTSGTIKLSIPEDMSSPYAAGTMSLSFNVTISGAWIPVSNNVNLNTGGVYADMTTRLLYLDGTTTFKVPDFMNSGVDFIFTMTTPGNAATYITPTTNYVDAATAYPDFGWGEYPYEGGWFLYDTAAAEYPYWSPDGVTYPEIYLMEFEDATDYMQLVQEDGTGYIFLSPYIYYYDGGGKYLSITMTFTPEFTPFETTE